MHTLKSNSEKSSVLKTYYDSLTDGNYDNANVFFGGFDDKKQERKAQE